ncbi:hypothetical protein [Streptomyces sp. MJM8645]|uniref:hypothetical protein n=1 Tax=Streptomycetaceae TaxID=2062 RepID=UPI0007AEE993|nr:hypothetical protein [Streptomyces sp. MJM8645]
MAFLREGEWNLTYDGDGLRPGADLLFGTLNTGIYLLNEPSLDHADGVLGDAPLPQEDGLRFGQDTTSSTTVSFELAVDTVNAARTTVGRHTANLGAVDTLLAAWDAATIRRRMGAVAVLRTMQGGRIRRAYGRPRSIAPANTRFTRQGSTSLVATFLIADGRWYDDAEESTTPTAAPAPIRGLTSPLTAALSQRVPAPPQPPGAMPVAGTVPTWPVTTVYGPGRNPKLTFFGPDRTQQGDLRQRMTIGLDLALADGEWVTIDPRPWARTVLRDDTASVAGALTRSSPRMQDMLLAPGLQHVRYSVVDDTGTSRATVAWRPAHRFY